MSEALTRSRELFWGGGDADPQKAYCRHTDGVSAVGWDSYFWRKKSPEQTAADLSTVITTYSAKWHADKVALIGFSFGADVLPFAYDRLRPAVKQHIVMMSLLSLAPAADWEFASLDGSTPLRAPTQRLWRRKSSTCQRQ